MATTFQKFNSFPQALASEKHNFGSLDVLKIALVNNTTPPLASYTQLSQMSQISTYANVITTPIGGLVVAYTPALVGAQYRIPLASMTMTATGGPIEVFRYVVLYNDTAPLDEVIGWLDYGATNLTLANTEQLIITFPADCITIGT